MPFYRRKSRRTRKQRSKYNRRSRNKRMKTRRLGRRHRSRRYQKGGKNKPLLKMDNRYRPGGGLEDTLKYNGKKLYNKIVGNYPGVNPSVSNQPIGNDLSISDLQFSVGPDNQAAQIYANADKQAAAYTNST